MGAFDGMRGQVYASYRVNGTPITFTKRTRTLTNRVSEAHTDTTTALSGIAMLVRGDAKQYEKESLTSRKPITLSFVSLAGEIPADGATATFAGVARTVARTYPDYAPDGTVLSVKVVLIV